VHVVSTAEGGAGHEDTKKAKENQDKTESDKSEHEVNTLTVLCYNIGRNLMSLFSLGNNHRRWSGDYF